MDVEPICQTWQDLCQAGAANAASSDGCETDPPGLAMSSARIFLILGALSAGLSVVLSAAFAHWPAFANGIPTAAQTALNQQQFHALGLILVSLALGWRGPSRWWVAAGWLMVLGMGLFSFNIYARALLGWDGLRALVPWGGSAWIAAWLLLAVGAVGGDYEAH